MTTAPYLDEPSLFDSLKAWQRQLQDLRNLPNDVALKPDMIMIPERVIHVHVFVEEGRPRRGRFFAEIFSAR
jgi:hypothetical protein